MPKHEQHDGQLHALVIYRAGETFSIGLANVDGKPCFQAAILRDGEPIQRSYVGLGQLHSNSDRYVYINSARHPPDFRAGTGSRSSIDDLFARLNAGADAALDVNDDVSAGSARIL